MSEQQKAPAGTEASDNLVKKIDVIESIARLLDSANNLIEATTDYTLEVRLVKKTNP
ncbi:hypothetical protein EXIGUO8H_20371 [Exiguobacterium sp. 8H]|uniref:hypothetical protein n=1 Tax=unclassified Exiguobacterium TaxID=2644629 RepID=UPI0012F22AF7|nr:MULTISPECIES: hypothetical protein [unclassified Exiguobacterium]VXB53002.1 hypothetical protein EXIGUO8A_11440 [Exiguobacterium sp. 8A]VXB53612.1 hypothetical protein EXIGUO8H_20371 [Exiguobacterium sp. 8H]